LFVHRLHVSIAHIVIDKSTITEAAARIAGFVRHTPVLPVEIGPLETATRETSTRALPADDPALGRDFTVTLKLEMLQLTGSFKPRGAFNRLLSAAVPAAGVIAASGGNHGAAVAFAAKRLGLAAEVFVPQPTPAAKLARIAGYGARVVQAGANYAEALAACQDRQRATGALNVHAYDQEAVLSGQGTVGREFAADVPDLTHVLVATGGGGLIGGVAAWYAGSAAVISVEPEACPGLHQALRAGRPVAAPVSGVAADSLGASQIGALMFPIAQRYVAESVLVADAAILAAQRWLWETCRVVTEPGGATALAALLSGRFRPPAGARVGVIVCGANTDPGSVVA
jgi:threonine dehydratase